MVAQQGGLDAVPDSEFISMVSVFSVFTTLSTVSFKMLGVGLSLAVFLDATIVRGVLLPAALALLGRHAWTLPTWPAWNPDWSEDRESPSSAASSTRRVLRTSTVRRL